MPPKRTAPKTSAGGGKRASSSTVGAPKRRRRAVQAPPKVSAPGLNDSDSDEEEDDEPPARATDGACLACLEIRKDEMATGVAHPACLPCFRRYRQAFTVYGTFDEFAEKLHTEEAVKAHWAMAAKVEQSSSAASWFPSEVDHGNAIELDIERSMIGLDRAQLMNITDNIPPETLGIKLDNLKNERGVHYKGLLVINPTEPYLKYVYRHRTTVIHTNKCMTSSMQLFDEQPTLTFNFKRDEVESQKGLASVVTKMKTAPYTLETLKNKVSAYRKKEAAGAAAEASEASKAMAAAAAAASAEQADSAPAENFGPVLNRQAFRDSMSVVDGGAASVDFSKTRSPGQKVRRGKAASNIGVGSNGTIDEATDLVNRKIKAFSLARIFNGDALGRELHWARDALDDLQGEENRVNRGRLLAHIDLGLAAMGLAEGSISKMDIDELDKHISALHTDGVDLLTSYKTQIFNRKCKILVGTNGGGETDMARIRKLLVSITPWRMPQDDADDTMPEEFNPLDPKLSFMEGSPMEHSNTFQSYIYEALLTNVDGNGKEKHILQQKCNIILEYLDDNAAEESEEYDSAITKVVSVANAILGLIDPCFELNADAFSEIDAAMASKDPDVKGSALFALCRALKMSDFYSTQRSALLKTLDNTKKHMKDIKMWKARLSEACANDMVMKGFATDLAKVAPLWIQQVRDGVFDDVLTTASANMKEYCQLFDFSNLSDMSKIQDTMASLRKFREALIACKEFLRADLTFWNQQLERATDAEVSIRKAMTSEGFTKLGKTFSAEDMNTRLGPREVARDLKRVGFVWRRHRGGSLRGSVECPPVVVHRSFYGRGARHHDIAEHLGLAACSEGHKC